jgi:hypothetical protein
MGNPYHLYDLAETLRFWVEAALDLETGEIVDVDADKISDNLREQLGAHLLDAACAVRELEAEAEAVGSEVRRLGARRGALDRCAAILRLILTDVLPGKMRDARVSISLGQSTRIEVFDAEQLDVSLLRIVTSPDAKAIKDALASEDTDARARAEKGARLVHAQHVVIR